MAGKIGVLALQGGFTAHYTALSRLGYQGVLVRYPKDLDQCQALILPGGESTTMLLQAHNIGLTQPLIEFAQQTPLFGTCAGLILMAQWGILDVQVIRNAYGRQIDSFINPLDFGNQRIPAVFIRAPIIKQVGPSVKVLATHHGHPVFIQQGHHFAATFHPELTLDDTLMKYVLSALSQPTATAPA